MTDRKLRDMRNEDKVVIDSRTAYHWIPESFKVYLDLAPEIAQTRILGSLKENKLRNDSEKVSSEEEIYRKMKERFESEQKRYWKLYKIDNTDKKQFDLVIDTNKTTWSRLLILLSRSIKNGKEEINIPHWYLGVYFLDEVEHDGDYDEESRTAERLWQWYPSRIALREAKQRWTRETPRLEA